MAKMATALIPLIKERTGRAINLLTMQSIEKSDNWIRRAEILQTALVIYEL